jgi:DNA repair protein RAD16
MVSIASRPISSITLNHDGTNSLLPASFSDLPAVALGVTSRSTSANRARSPAPSSRPSRKNPVDRKASGLAFAATPAESAATSPIDTWSENDNNDTPLTSAVPTPAPSDSSKPGGRRIEVVIESAKPSSSSAKALRRSKYSMASKRKRGMDDSEDDVSDNSPDAIVARRLQLEEDSKVREPRSGAAKLPLRLSTASRPKRSSVARTSYAQSADEKDEEEDADGFVIFSPKARRANGQKGKAAVHGAQSAKRSILSFASEDEEDYGFEEDGDSDHLSLPPVKKLRSTISTAKIKSAVSKGKKSVKLASVGTAQKSASTITVHDEKEDAELSELSDLSSDDEDFYAASDDVDVSGDDSDEDDDADPDVNNAVRAAAENRRHYRATNQRAKLRVKRDRKRLEHLHPELLTMWTDLEQMPIVKTGKSDQPASISRQLKGFQLEGLAWMQQMEKMEWKGGLLGDEMGLGKTIQAVSLIMSDWPAKKPTLVLVPPVALMQWQSEIKSYTDGTLKTFVYHITNSKSKSLSLAELKTYDVIMMSYNSLESMYRKQEKGFKRKEGIYKEQSLIHRAKFHRVILDEAHSIKTRTTMTAKACFALQTDYRWCLTGTPLQNRIGEFFSLIRFLNIQPFASYFCKACKCTTLEWSMDEDNRCKDCNHTGMQHVSVFNQELLNPIQKYGNKGPGADAFKKLRLMTDRIMLRRLKKDHTNAMDLPVKEIFVERQFFGEEENDFANSIMTNGQRKFDTYVASGVLLNNYANIFGLIMQMRQVADHPDLILKKNSEGAQNVIVCCICDDVAEEAIRSRCKHDFCRACAKSYITTCMESGDEDPRCPHCHIALSIDLEQPEIVQDEMLVKKSSIINRIKMENWTSSSKIELLVHELHKLRSDKASHKSIIFSQFTTMLQLIEWRLRRAGITTVMLDGSMTPAQRQASIEHFMNNVDVECFLVSLKAGGVALNLTEASRVFIVDP